jgi:hypothetical protein
MVRAMVLSASRASTAGAGCVIRASSSSLRVGAYDGRRRGGAMPGTLGRAVGRSWEWPGTDDG